MARTTRSWMVGFILGSSLVAAAPASAQHTTGTRLMVFVADYAGVPAGILERAEEQTTRIFQAINVELIGLKQGDVRFKDPSVLNSVITIHILSREMVDLAKKPGSVMGWAATGTRIVKVSYNGIAAFIGDDALSSTRGERDTACVLGHVVAHEIGHLLLPSGAHSRAGIMQARLDRRLAARGGLFFSTSEAHVIRTKLAMR